MKKLYSVSAVENLITELLKKDYVAVNYREGVCGCGDWILYKDNKHLSIVIKDIYINAWSSGHTITMFKKLPKKYAEILENY